MRLFNANLPRLRPGWTDVLAAETPLMMTNLFAFAEPVHPVRDIPLASSTSLSLSASLPVSRSLHSSGPHVCGHKCLFQCWKVAMAMAMSWVGLGWDPFGFLLFLQHLTLIWFFAKLSWHFSPGLFVFLGIQQGFLKQGSKAVSGSTVLFLHAVHN